MLLHDDPDTASDFASEEAEALFKEARRRARRRHLHRGFAVAVVLGVAAIAYLAGGSGDGGIIAESASGPFVDVKAFSGDGRLAFISRGTLWVLDGAAASLRKVAPTTPSAPVAPGSPTFSHDGRWLAYLLTPQSAYGSPSQLWIAHADGTGAHEVAKLAVDQLLGWSPTADVLAVIADAKGWYLNDQQGQLPVEVELVSAHGAVRRLLALSTSPTRPGQVESAVWSPDGSEIAVSVANPRLSVATTLAAYPVGGGRPTTWFSIGQRQSLPGACGSPSRTCSEVVADLAGWWPGWGIGFWVYADGMTHNNDSTRLELLSAPRASPRVIAQTLSDGTTDAVTAGRDDGLALVSSASGPGRTYTQGKTVETCNSSTRTCVPLPGAAVWSGARYRPQCPGGCGGLHQQPPGRTGSGVSLDPAWAPNGKLLAYVKAPTSPTLGWAGLLAWYSAHELFVWNRQTNTTREIADIEGVSLPTWSKNGRQLLYVANNGLWLAPLAGKPTQIEYPLFPPQQWKNVDNDPLAYYGQINWTDQFSWWSG